MGLGKQKLKYHKDLESKKFLVKRICILNQKPEIQAEKKYILNPEHKK